MLGNRYSYSWREIPIFKILDWRVVRFIPSLTAAPRGPAITPLVSREDPDDVLAFETLQRAIAVQALCPASQLRQRGVEDPAFREDYGASIRFSSSRTLSGHSQFTSAVIVALGMISICLFMRRENF